MDNSFLKFLVDLGSIGAIVIVCWLNQKDRKVSSEERIETHRQFCDTLNRYLEVLKQHEKKTDDE